jgi:adenine-specific DNA-methyltransferase
MAIAPIEPLTRQAGFEGSAKRHPVVELLDGDGAPSDNLLVWGDASFVLGTLATDPRYRTQFEGGAKLCYLDPPFNTGEDFVHYQDSTKLEEWRTGIRSVLSAVRRLLAPTGSVWFHINDAYQHHARALLDDVFGGDAFVATVIWQKRTSRDNRTAISSMHEYLHVYSPVGQRRWKSVRNLLPDPGSFSNPDDDPRGPWRSAPMSAQAGHGTASQFYAVTSPSGAQHHPPHGRCWTYTQGRLQELDAEGRVYWPRNGAGRPRLKRYQTEVQGVIPSSLWLADEVGDNGSAKKDLISQFPSMPPFDTPKPIGLLERILTIATDPDDLVVDPYLGSGTTAVVASTMSRRWVGIDREESTLRLFVRPRLAASGSANHSYLRIHPYGDA